MKPSEMTFVPEKSDFRLPDTLAALSISVLNLPVRSYNALLSNNINTVGQLVRLSDEKILKIRNLGRKSLADIREALGEFTRVRSIEIEGQENPLETSPQHIDANSTIHSNAFSSGGWKVPGNTVQIIRQEAFKTILEDALTAPVEILDLSARSLHALGRRRISSVAQLLAYPKRLVDEAENIGRKSRNEIESKVFAYLEDQFSQKDRQITSEQPPLGTKAFVDEMLSRLPERQRNVIADRYGLWDGIAETLQDIGDKLGVTRERIRQIEEKGLLRIRRVYGYSKIRHFILSRVTRYFAENQTACGLISEDEIANVFADDCPSDQTILGIDLLQDLSSPLAKQFVEAESGVYSIDRGIALEYRQLLSLIEKQLIKYQRPISRQQLDSGLIEVLGRDVTEKQAPLLKRMFDVSSSVARLPNDTFLLSIWKGLSKRDATSVTEAVLRRLGRPAHFREIAERARALFPEARTNNERTFQNVLIRRPDIFVWVKSGTYGLTVWGLKKPPYIKDRLIELLSQSNYPLPYWHLKEKVLETCNCKETSVQMTLDLNPQVFKKFEGDQYGLQRHYA